VLLPVGAVATTVLVVGAVLVGNLGDSSEDAAEPRGDVLSYVDDADRGAEAGAGRQQRLAQPAAPAEGPLYDAEGSSASAGATSAPEAVGPSPSGAATQAPKRSVERSARMTIATGAQGVGDAASRVFDVVHANNGIVLSSSISDGSDEDAGAEFELLIPSGRLGDALAAFSAIGEVLSRNESTADITAPTVGAAERLQDSRARIDSLLGQLAEASTESEREAVERELRAERRRAAHLRERLSGLKRRANLSRVSLGIVSDDSAGAAGGWSVGDAFDDAGRVLAVALAVAIVALAVLAPVAILALLAWLAHRAWLRRARTRALG
jgi:hypothetical protein